MGEREDNFWRCLLLCHDVIKVNGELSGASPDEIQFLEMAEQFGYAKFLERTTDQIKI